MMKNTTIQQIPILGMLWYVQVKIFLINKMKTGELKH